MYLVLTGWLASMALAGPDLDFGPTVSRDELVHSVIARNPALEAAEAAVTAARARIRASGAWPEPRIGASLAPLSLGGHATGWGVELAQALPLSGRPGLERTMARVRAARAEQDLAAVRLELAHATSELFDDWWLVERALELARVHVERLEELERSVRDRYVVGRAPEAAVLTAEVERLRLEREILALAARRDGTLAALNALLHREVDAPLAPPEAPSEPRTTPPSADLPVDWPDLRSIQASAELARVQERLARRAWTPDPMLMTEYSNMWPHEDHRWMVGLSVDVPVAVGARHGAVDAARAERAAAEARLARALDDAMAEQHRSWLEADAARRAWELLAGRLVPVAAQRTDAARIAFEADRLDFQDLVEAERALLEAELAAHTALADHHRALAALAAARGELPGASR